MAVRHNDLVLQHNHSYMFRPSSSHLHAIHNQTSSGPKHLSMIVF